MSFGTLGLSLHAVVYFHADYIYDRMLYTYQHMRQFAHVVLVLQRMVRQRLASHH